MLLRVTDRNMPLCLQLMLGSAWLPKAMVFNVKSSYRVNDQLPRETPPRGLGLACIWRPALAVCFPPFIYLFFNDCGLKSVKKLFFFFAKVSVRHASLGSIGHERLNMGVWIRVVAHCLSVTGE